MTIASTQDLLTRLTTIDAAAERRFPVSADNVKARTDALRAMIGDGCDLAYIRAEAIDMKGWAYLGSGAGMKWLDATWARLVEAFPVPLEEIELAAHIANDMMEANR